MTRSKTTRAFRGLLRGFKRQSDITAFSEMFYTKVLDVDACKKLYKENGMWKSFMQDMKPDESPDQVIESISKAAEEFLIRIRYTVEGKLLRN